MIAIKIVIFVMLVVLCVMFFPLAMFGLISWVEFLAKGETEQSTKLFLLGLACIPGGILGMMAGAGLVDSVIHGGEGAQ